ncbi:MAG TPA: carboxypeptidase regulatory-like domain-containing protein, partial [Bryobacteraceae bacterium]|nr:carboxypeptidase regulatory-like domain-containing protein [Bryobacteraceae bacterium]
MKKAVVLLLLGGACAAVGPAQTPASFGAVSGTIREASGEGIPDTTVSISNDNLGIRRNVVTTDDGVFNAPGLVPGAGYTLKVTRKGFQSWEKKDLEIPLGRTLAFEITLMREGQGGGEAGRTPTPDTEHEVAHLVTQPDMDALPSSARRADPLVALAPGVAQNPATGVLAVRGEPFTNAFLTDGAFTTSQHYLDKPGIAPQLTQDQISQMQALSAMAAPELGHSAGGIVNAVTRNGTNGFHGELYDFFNDASLNAPNRYAPDFHPTGWQHQGGGSAGGSIFPDKLFWFLNVEAADGKSQGLNLLNNPLIGVAGGREANPANCAAPATPAQCAAAINFINSQLNTVVNRSLFSVNGLAKLDWRPDENNSISFSGGAFHSDAPNGANMDEVATDGSLRGANGSLNQETRQGRLSWGRTLASGFAFNDMSASLYHVRSSDYEDSQLLPAINGTATKLGIYIAGTDVGANPAFPNVVSENRWTYADNLSVTMNTHLVKVGVEYVRREDRTFQIFNSAGTYYYPSLTTFAEDFTSNPSARRSYTSYSQGFGVPVVDLHIPEFNWYLQDSWRPLRRLSLTYGVRWEKPYMPKPTYTNSSFYQTGSIPSTNKDIAPRIGASYLLNGSTVLRAGFGEFFQPFPGQLLDALFAGNGIYQENISLNPNQTGAPYFGHVIASASSVPTGSASVFFAQPGKFRNPYVEEAVLSLERRLGSKTTLTVSGISSTGFRLWTLSDQNVYAPTIVRTYTIDNAAGAAVGTFPTWIVNTKGNSSFSHAYQVNNAGESWYHALTVQWNHSMSHGLSVHAAYTWSHAMDDVGGAPVPWLGFLAPAVINADYRSTQANSPFDQRHRGVISWTWAPRVTKSNSMIARYVLNGWQLSGIATIASPMYETPIVLVNGQQFSGVTMLYTNSLNGSGGSQQAPFLRAGSLPTGREHTVDARVSRAIPITERVKAMLML